MAGIFLGAGQPLFREGVTIDDILSIEGIAGVSAVYQVLYTGSDNYITPIPGGTRTTYVDIDRNDGTYTPQNRNRNQVFSMGAVTTSLRNGGVYKATGSPAAIGLEGVPRVTGSTYKFTFSDLPDLDSLSGWTRVDNIVTCSAPDTQSPIRVYDSQTDFEAVHTSSVYGSDGWRVFFANGGNVAPFVGFDSGVPDAAWPVDKGPPWRQTDGSYTSTPELRNRWKWMNGQPTVFNGTCTVTWNPNPNVRITQINVDGLRGVTSIRVRGITSGGTQRFSQTVTVSTGETSKSIDFAVRNPVASDRYEVRLSGGNGSEFRFLSFGSSEAISTTATLEPGSQLKLFDYSQKAAAGFLLKGQFSDDYDMRYKIDTAENTSVYDKLVAASGRRLSFNLGEGLEAVSGYIRKFEIIEKHGLSDLRLRIEGLS